MVASKSSGRHAVWVGAGILLSRLVGLVRTKLLAHYLGTSIAGTALLRALQIPNFLQNLLGEGVLSASFIPVYAGLRAQKKEQAATDVANAVFGLLCLANAVLVAVGVLTAPWLVTALAPGFEPATRDIMVPMVRLFFPATSLLVLSAWCLGILNSHRKFFLSYAAPVVWSGAIIAALLIFEKDADKVAWGVVVGSGLQFAIQLPSTFKLLGVFRPALNFGSPDVRAVLKAFVPAVVARGVVQVSSYIDQIVASLAGELGASILTYTQTISMLPVSLFGMAISASELPSMSEEAAGLDEARKEALKKRIESAVERLLFFVIPSAAAFVFIGDVLAAPLLQGTHYDSAAVRVSWYVLMGSSIGLVGSTQSRLFSSAFFSLKDTRTPLKFAVARVVTGAGLSIAAVMLLPQYGVPPHVTVAGIAAASGIGAWVEYFLLKRSLEQRLSVKLSTSTRKFQGWSAAIAAGALGLGTKSLLTAEFGADEVARSEWMGNYFPAPALNSLVVAAAVLAAFGVVYLSFTVGWWKNVLKRKSLR